MHLRWSCTENNFQCKNILSGTYDVLALNKKEQKITTYTYDIYFHLKSSVIFVIYKYEFITLLNARVVFPWPRLRSLFKTQKCLFCKIVQNALPMFSLTPRYVEFLVNRHVFKIFWLTVYVKRPKIMFHVFNYFQDQ